MKKSKILIPALTIASVGAVVAPMAAMTSCNPKNGSSGYVIDTTGLTDVAYTRQTKDASGNTRITLTPKNPDEMLKVDSVTIGDTNENLPFTVDHNSNAVVIKKSDLEGKKGKIKINATQKDVAQVKIVNETEAQTLVTAYAATYDAALLLGDKYTKVTLDQDDYVVIGGVNKPITFTKALYNSSLIQGVTVHQVCYKVNGYDAWTLTAGIGMEGVWAIIDGVYNQAGGQGYAEKEFYTNDNETLSCRVKKTDGTLLLDATCGEDGYLHKVDLRTNINISFHGFTLELSKTVQHYKFSK